VVKNFKLILKCRWEYAKVLGDALKNFILSTSLSCPCFNICIFSWITYFL